jgi:SAM-dependent methyltransferase
LKDPEVKKYYLSVTDEDVISDLSPHTFDIWEIIQRFQKKLDVGKRLIDIGGGIGSFAYEALKRGYDVTVTDFLKEFTKKVIKKYPKLKGRVYLLDIFDEKNVSRFVEEMDQFDVVTVLGSVLNHAKDKGELEKGFYNVLKLGDTNSLFVIDLLVEEMFPGRPSIIWSDFKHTLASFSEIGEFLREYGLRLLDLYSIHESYTCMGKLEKYEEHSIRLFIFKPW